ncbi:carboxypeptidase-like regulatory domain-containing protein [uncultured Proteiniphilum sp.]|uniref:carboxypeptidase-like regulatory domain-containing protein n=1 Tax=uncultured Proteiniphilum sp. TaxID=497637 RepID=UPI0026221A52|nr:carboxypeptidase-like regulatory domain-containing protein [uncultured Proteiniphilum sp.]
MNRINFPGYLNKAIIILFLSLPYYGNAQNHNKKITIQERNIPIKAAFSLIEQQTDYSIAYEQSMLDTEKRISLSLKNVTIENALTQILEDTRNTFKIKGYHVIISPENTEKREDNKNKPTQTIRGRVVDSDTGIPIEFASVLLENTAIGNTTDSVGRFRINRVPVGRYNIRISYMGYKTKIIPEIPVSSSKEITLEISLEEEVQRLNEVVILPQLNKDAPLNPMALTGGRMISMEEAGRFANGFDDPARLVAAFAGVAGDVGSNAIAIRGNSPQFIQWKLEGVEIPNPTHFADLMGLGGGFLSALSSQIMGNSDFYNGVFPAEYNNALSGVFDMYMRNGNNQQYEHTLQAGLLGFDLASEGPINKKYGSSYIFNYRFSNTSLATGGDTPMKYQDVSFKFNFPTRQAGTFSIWGLGLRDRSKFEAEDREKWETQGDRQAAEYKLEKMAGGFTHKYKLNESTNIKSSIAATYSQDHSDVDQHTKTGQSIIEVADILNRKWDIVFSSYINKKINARHTNRTGITFTGLLYDLDYKVSPDFGLDKPMERISEGSGKSSVFSAFSSSIIDINDRLTASVGLTTQFFTLNDNWTLEPRLALKWNIKPRHSFAVSYGMYSRREKLDYYFVERQINNVTESNRYLDFSRSHHFGLTYDWKIAPLLHLKIEPYYQYLYNIPIEKGTPFSVINHQAFYLDKILVNEGKGRNYGVDVTLEKYMNNGFYYMMTGSLFKSKYMGSDGIWRNTRLDRGYLFNFLSGKEWLVGRRRQNIFNLNVRLFFQGGDRYTPIDEEKSKEIKDIVFDETKAFIEKFNPAINGDVSVSYKINKKKLSHEFSLKVLNIGGYTGAHFYQYNENTDQVKKEKGFGIIPNISYKIEF